MKELFAYVGVGLSEGSKTKRFMESSYQKKTCKDGEDPSLKDSEYFFYEVLGTKNVFIRWISFFMNYPIEGQIKYHRSC